MTTLIHVVPYAALVLGAAALAKTLHLYSVYQSLLVGSSPLRRFITIGLAVLAATSLTHAQSIDLRPPTPACSFPYPVCNLSPHHRKRHARTPVVTHLSPGSSAP